MAIRRSALLLTVIVFGLVGLVSVLEYKRQAVSAQLSVLAEQLKNADENDVPKEVEDAKQQANRIISEVRALMTIADDIEPTVATIVDVELLRQRNPFYNKAENGDHLIITTDRAILYRSSEKKIIDVVPIQLEPVENAGGSAAE